MKKLLVILGFLMIGNSYAVVDEDGKWDGRPPIPTWFKETLPNGVPVYFFRDSENRDSRAKTGKVQFIVFTLKSTSNLLGRAYLNCRLRVFEYGFSADIYDKYLGENYQPERVFSIPLTEGDRFSEAYRFICFTPMEK